MNRIETELEGAGLRIGIVMSRFNPQIGQGELASCLQRLHERGVSVAAITLVTIPGALEAPLALQRLAQSGKFDALIALGAVIRGETYHFEIVADQSAAGIAQVQLDLGIPIANGILTTDTDEQALARMKQKGQDCAETAIEMANLVRKFA